MAVIEGSGKFAEFILQCATLPRKYYSVAQNSNTEQCTLEVDKTC
jgi:hypothetical protein